MRKGTIPLQDIGYLLVTHYHPDHAGLAQELKARQVLAGLESQRRPRIHETIKLHISFTALEEVDAEALAWLEHAYDQNSEQIARSISVQ